MLREGKKRQQLRQVALQTSHIGPYSRSQHARNLRNAVTAWARLSAKYMAWALVFTWS